MAENPEQAKREALVAFGAELQRLRSLADISQRELAKQTLVSHQMVGAIERAERSPRKDFAEKADKILGAKGALIQLWQGGRQSHPHWFKEFLELEAEARSFQSFQVQAIPGLFQTRSYASAIFAASWPPISKDTTAQLLRIRMGRQEILAREEPPLFSAVLDEGVLRRPVGGVDAMVEQLERLETLAVLPYIHIQVLPFARGVHAAMDGNFVLLDMGRGDHLVYFEGPGRGNVVAEASRVEESGLRFAALRSLALSPEESLRLIGRYKEEHVHGIEPF